MKTPRGLDDPRYGTHLVPLAACLGATKGPVLEVGCGHWSTPFLQRYCLAAGREFVSVEEDATWAVELGVRHARYDLVLPELAAREWSVVLIDHWPEARRMPDALLFRSTAEHVLVHDAIKSMRHSGGKPPAGWPFKIEHDTLVLSA